MSFFTNLIFTRVSENNRLRKLETLINWAPIKKILLKKCQARINPVSGVKPYDVLCMFNLETVSVK